MGYLPSYLSDCSAKLAIINSSPLSLVPLIMSKSNDQRKCGDGVNYFDFNRR